MAKFRRIEQKSKPVTNGSSQVSKVQKVETATPVSSSTFVPTGVFGKIGDGSKSWITNRRVYGGNIAVAETLEYIKYDKPQEWDGTGTPSTYRKHVAYIAPYGVDVNRITIDKNKLQAAMLESEGQTESLLAISQRDSNTAQPGSRAFINRDNQLFSYASNSFFQSGLFGLEDVSQVQYSVLGGKNPKETDPNFSIWNSDNSIPKTVSDSPEIIPVPSAIYSTKASYTISGVKSTTVTQFDQGECSYTEGVFMFLFNPESLELSLKQRYSSSDTYGAREAGQEGLALQWTGSENAVLSFKDVKLHGYLFGRKVQKLENALIDLALARANPSSPEPRLLEFVWGNRTFGPCVIDDIVVVEERWADGDVVNAKLNFTLTKVPKWQVNDGLDIITYDPRLPTNVVQASSTNSSPTSEAQTSVDTPLTSNTIEPVSTEDFSSVKISGKKLCTTQKEYEKFTEKYKTTIQDSKLWKSTVTNDKRLKAVAERCTKAATTFSVQEKANPGAWNACCKFIETGLVKGEIKKDSKLDVGNDVKFCQEKESNNEKIRQNIDFLYYKIWNAIAQEIVTGGPEVYKPTAKGGVAQKLDDVAFPVLNIFGLIYAGTCLTAKTNPFKPYEVIGGLPPNLKLKQIKESLKSNVDKLVLQLKNSPADFRQELTIKLSQDFSRVLDSCINVYVRAGSDCKQKLDADWYTINECAGFLKKAQDYLTKDAYKITCAKKINGSN